MRRHEISHETPVFIRSPDTDKSAFVIFRNATQCETDYSYIKQNEALISEEVLYKLGISWNTKVVLDINTDIIPINAISVTLNYLEFYNSKTGSWQRKPKLENDSNSSNNDDKSFKLLDRKSANKDDGFFPSLSWWEQLIQCDDELYIKSILSRSPLDVGSIVKLNKNGILTKFEVSDIAGQKVKKYVDCFYRINESTKITVSVTAAELHNKQEKINSTINLGGMSSQLDILKWHVLYPLIYREKSSKISLYPPGGVLLYGPPGCGKTLLCKWLRENYNLLIDSLKDGEIEIHFKMVQSTDLISTIVGGTEHNIVNLFDDIKDISRTQPCICVIDEIDILCKSRDQGDSFNHRNVTAFLNNMDGINENGNYFKNERNYVIIGTTNDIDTIDLALRRPGRFDLEIEVGVPNNSDRLDILKKLLNDLDHTLTNDDVIYINDFCQAFVGADIKALITNAARDRFNKCRKQYTAGALVDEKPQLTRDNFMEALKYTKPSALKELTIEIPKVKWDDIGGYQNVKSILKECVEYPRLYSGVYQQLHVQIPSGILLYGPPGCCKTLLAKAVATESHMNFISVKGPELLSKWVGESERAIRNLFHKARVNAPCVIFFDEIDSIATSRDTCETGVTSRVLSQILNEMDGINNVKQVVVIAATNRPDLLDSALLRPGRLDRLIYISLPDINARRQIFRIYLGKLPVDKNELDTLSEDMAHVTQGYSGAEIALICNEAAMIALREYIADCKRSKKDVVDALEMLKLTKKVSGDHVKAAIDQIKPRTKPETIEFYQKYNKQHGIK
ncbi:bifunctional P-loop containing nucleoside triphosphate hydrolase/AAA+ ATPase domain/AAA ATPase [Babesia duncani]|uniref:Bifunctional P-loop containing nucleoside triphosphate hydrolase/AAA+ ATPase domain/AAA ATPase n=1 Tax=Babesia duncani TaxID=323732 RepID=A0AAD9PIX5_9APIC|nr:bifunctional P-loop containing nucleoside triphosphate hydrolase/AAA+ ATPase domain/AAA ATPase [Babesia duncani]